MNDTVRTAAVTMLSIDIETAPDPQAAKLLSFTRPEGRVHVALHRIVAAAWLRASEREDGSWSIDELASRAEETEEDDILADIDEQLRTVSRGGGEICTYNGARHDLPVIRRRAKRHWMFSADGIFRSAPYRHVDMMTLDGEGGRNPPKLREICAGIGIPCDPTPMDGRHIHPHARKAEVDATATWLLRLHHLAAERGNRDVLVSAWSALADFIRRVRRDDAHLRQFTRSAELAAALRIRARCGRS